jgi:outer membrane protein OmpA-like peptidoglycan-associated protein
MPGGSGFSVDDGVLGGGARRIVQARTYKRVRAGSSLLREGIMGICVISAFAAFLLISAGHASAADLPGSKDPSGLKRYEGSEIIHYATNPYQPYSLARDVAAIGDAGFAKSERVEGSVVRVVYRVPEGVSSLEVFRNYEQALADLGFEQTFEIADGRVGEPYSEGYFLGKFYFQSEMGARFAHETHPFGAAKSSYYVTAKGTQDGKDVWVAVLAIESPGGSWQEPSAKQPFAIKPGQAVVGVDVITSKTIAQKMVLVKADEMAKALTDSGKIDIYGVLFDVDKTTIKPDSKATLDEVAKLLKDNPDLKLEVAGHTDSTGGDDHNLKLSEGRAAAVVDALVKTYAIDASRLQAKGYGSSKPVATNDTDAGRAKNRRVELRKI